MNYKFKIRLKQKGLKGLIGGKAEYITTITSDDYADAVVELNTELERKYPRCNYRIISMRVVKTK